MSRFELENYKNTLIFDGFILVSTTFYQSVDHFKFRTKNAKHDELKKISDIQALEFHSIGNILTLKFDDRTRKLEFTSNQQMMEFLDLIETNNFVLASKENLPLKTAILPIIIPSFIFFAVLFIALAQYGPKGIFKYFMLCIGVIFALLLTVKKHLKSSITVYKKDNTAILNKI